jgi:trans-aconitate methyltransferase
MDNFNSKKYWEERYQKGGNSGNGSYGFLADFKANIINNFIIENDIKSVVELGCGDGNQLSLLKMEEYLGLDVSKKIVNECKKKFPQYSFEYSETFKKKKNQNFDLTLSLDVIFHLVEDITYEEYMKKLIDLDGKYLIIYSCNFKDNGTFGTHVKPRIFTDHSLLKEKYQQIKFIKNQYPSTNHKKGSFSDFYIFKKI